MSELVESVERIVVEALAKMHASTNRSPANEPDSSVVTRDIINAIADGLERAADKGSKKAMPTSLSGYSWGTWLRSQATEGDENG